MPPKPQKQTTKKKPQNEIKKKAKIQSILFQISIFLKAIVFFKLFKKKHVKFERNWL